MIVLFFIIVVVVVQQSFHICIVKSSICKIIATQKIKLTKMANNDLNGDRVYGKTKSMMAITASLAVIETTKTMEFKSNGEVESKLLFDDITATIETFKRIDEGQTITEIIQESSDKCHRLVIKFKSGAENNIVFSF